MAMPGSRLRLAFLTALISGSVCAQPDNSPLHTSLLIASDFVHSGLSQTGSDPVLRFSADYEHATGFFAGGSLANAEYAADSGRQSRRDSLATLYAGYLWRAMNWSSNVSLARYVYPGFSPRYDYAEVTAGAAYRNRYFLSYSRSNNYFSLGQHTELYRAGLAFPWLGELEVGLNAGEYLTRGRFRSRYSFWDLGLSRVFGRFALDLRFHDSTYDRTSVIGEDPDDRWVFSVSYAISPRDDGSIERWESSDIRGLSPAERAPDRR
jgi:uncharacterized protein (TIGR02001 family)